jgi:uncharacterized secreted protein with C-terminal beta-propeller domain
MKKQFLFLSLFSLAFLTACLNTQPEPLINTGLKSLTSQAEFQALVRPHLESGTRIDGFFALRSLDGVPEVSGSLNSTMAESNQAEVSTTNVQIEGVDEGDIIKVDANRIYRIDGERFYVVAIENGQMEIIYAETIQTVSENEGFAYFSDLYLTDQYVVVIGQRYDFYTAIEGAELRIFPIFRFGTPFTLIKVFDRDTLAVVDEFEVSGSLNTSRLIDDQLYVLSYHSIYSLEDDFDPRPVFRINGEETMPDYKDIKYIDNVPAEAFTIITRVDLSSAPALSSDILLGSMGWGQVTINLNGIWFAETRWMSITNGIFNQEEWRPEGQLISYTFNEDGSLSFGGLGKYQGTIQNQFWMDEFEGFFRIVTTEGWGDDVINRLYIFERQSSEEGFYLAVVSMIDQGLGKPRETVRSVRFQGALATVVTFEMTDPLYTIDLTDPFNPVIRAGLEITGFATYQHPWDNNTLIGIGYETNPEGMIIGLKLTLFDISDWDNPVVMGDPLVLLSGENNWQFSEALHNHKAILIAQSKDFLGFSVGHYRYLRDDGYVTQDYLIFSVDESLAQPIQIVSTISHDDLFDAKGFQSWGFQMERAVYVNDVLYVISTVGVTSHQISDDFEQISALTFE